MFEPFSSTSWAVMKESFEKHLASTLDVPAEDVVANGYPKKAGVMVIVKVTLVETDFRRRRVARRAWAPEVREEWVAAHHKVAQEVVARAPGGACRTPST